jgi:protein-tyrosine sulfotransferase
MPSTDDILALIRGRPLRGREGYRPFFIVGSGRCGTTMLRAALEAHPDIHIPPETYVIGSVAQEYRLFSRLPWSTLLRIVLARFEYHQQFFTFDLTLRELYRELLKTRPRHRNLAYVINRLFLYHASRVKPTALRWGDKTPLHVFALPAIRRVFPDLHVINLVRDGRDVVQSFVSTGLLKTADEAAERWRSSIEAALVFARRHPAQVTNIYYEELVSDPGRVIPAICAAIGLPFLPAMLHSHQEARDLGDVPRLAHHARAVKPITSERIGAWREMLTRADADALTQALKPQLKMLGYLS